jgi:S-adenosylmethionine synthetase
MITQFVAHFQATNKDIPNKLRVCSKISAGKNPLEYSGWIRPILATKTASGISAGWNS